MSTLELFLWGAAFPMGVLVGGAMGAIIAKLGILGQCLFERWLQAGKQGYGFELSGWARWCMALRLTWMYDVGEVLG